jgi:hypothetical protein
LNYEYIHLSIDIPYKGDIWDGYITVNNSTQSKLFYILYPAEARTPLPPSIILLLLSYGSKEVLDALMVLETTSKLVPTPSLTKVED